MGYGVSVSSIEKVRLCPWKDIKLEASAPCRPDMRPGSQAPCGALIVFSITILK
jgi:hypothetical protein